IDRMIALVEGANRQKTPNEIALNILLAALTIIFLLAVATLQPLAVFAKLDQPGVPDSPALNAQGVTGIVLVSLLVCLIPTTIGALLSAIGIAGMDRLVQRNVLAMSGRAVEAAGDVNTLLLDKTGTITLGNREATEFVPVEGGAEDELADAAQLSSLADETPKGPAIGVYANRRYGLRERPMAFGSAEPARTAAVGEDRSSAETRMSGVDLDGVRQARFVPFSANSRMSGVDLPDGTQVRKGAATAVMKWVRDNGGHPTEGDGPLADGISASGGTPLVVAERRGRAAARGLRVASLEALGL